jgi:hypothetical protein
MQELMSFLPSAWIGYAIHPAGGFYVKVCERCPEVGRALKEAKSSDLRVSLTLCPACSYELTNKRMGEHELQTIR